MDLRYHPPRGVEFFLVTAGHDHGVAAIVQLPCKLLADAAASPGYQNGFVFQFHDGSLLLLYEAC